MYRGERERERETEGERERKRERREPAFSYVSMCTVADCCIRWLVNSQVDSEEDPEAGQAQAEPLGSPWLSKCSLCSLCLMGPNPIDRSWQVVTLLWNEFVLMHATIVLIHPTVLRCLPASLSIDSDDSPEETQNLWEKARDSLVSQLLRKKIMQFWLSCDDAQWMFDSVSSSQNKKVFELHTALAYTAAGRSPKASQARSQAQVLRSFKT